VGDEPQAVAAQPDNPFDLGDTSVYGDVKDLSVANQQNFILDPNPRPQKPGERPRNPDGTFAPTTEPSAQQVPASTEPAPVTIPPAPVSKHPAYLVQQAQEYGFDESEINDTPTHVLGKMVHNMMRQQMQARSDAAREALQVHGQVRNPAPEPPPPEEEFDIDFGTDPESGRKLTAQDFHPGLIAAFKHQAKQNREAQQKLQAELAKRDQRDEQRELNRAASIYDAAFAGLGPEYENIFGKGPGREMGADQQGAYKRRIAVLTEAQADPRQHTVAQVKAKIKAAADLLFPPVKAAPYAEVAKGKNGTAPPQRITPEQWEEGALARPTARTAEEEPPGEAKAVKNLKAKLDSQVIPDSEELDGFI
jgi:hypothetical protein